MIRECRIAQVVYGIGKIGDGDDFMRFSGLLTIRILMIKTLRLLIYLKQDAITFVFLFDSIIHPMRAAGSGK